MKKDRKSKAKEMKKDKKSKATAQDQADDPKKDTAAGKQPLNPNTKLLDEIVSQEEMYMKVSDDDEDFWDGEKYDQDLIERSASWYRRSEYYGSELEERTCIWSSGNSFKWSEKTSGIPWIGINGTDATLVVAMMTERKTMPGWTKLPSGAYILVPLCDMGVYADTTTASTKFRRQLIALNSPKKVGPFAVVSVPPGTTEDHLEVTNTDEAVDFLEKKLKGRSTLIYKEIEQIAVCALKVLLGLNFDSSMIQARASGKAEGPQSGKFSAAVVEKHLAAEKEIMVETP